MSHQELATAGEDLEAAAQLVTDPATAERLADLSDQLHHLAEATQGPDHGRLARIQAAMHDIQSGTNDDVETKINAANEAITNFRENLEGV